MRSWKTTVAGLVGAFCSFVLFSGQLHMINWPKWVEAVSMFVFMGGLATFGVVAKDYNVSGKASPPSKDDASK